MAIGWISSFKDGQRWLTHSQLVQAVDVLIARTRVLLRICVLLALAIVALLIVAVIR